MKAFAYEGHLPHPGFLPIPSVTDLGIDAQNSSTLIEKVIEKKIAWHNMYKRNMGRANFWPVPLILTPLVLINREIRFFSIIKIMIDQYSLL